MQQQSKEAKQRNEIGRLTLALDNCAAEKRQLVSELRGLESDIRDALVALNAGELREAITVLRYAVKRQEGSKS